MLRTIVITVALVSAGRMLSGAAPSSATHSTVHRPPDDSATLVRRATALVRADDIHEPLEVSSYRHSADKTVIELRVPGGGLGGHFIVTTTPGKVCLEIFD